MTDTVVKLTDESAKQLLDEMKVTAKNPRKWLWRRFTLGQLPSNRSGRDFFFDPEKVKRSLGGNNAEA